MDPISTLRPSETVLAPAKVPVDGPNPDPNRVGVHLDPAGGLNISVVAPHATAVDFCVVRGGEGERREQRWSLQGPKEGVWHGHIDGLGVGTQYGFRAFGPWNPDEGLYYNPSKFLIDPYARGLEGNPTLGAALHAHHVDHDLYPSTYPLAQSNLNSSLYMPTSVVVENRFAPQPHPMVPRSETVLYEMHVKGFTKNMPGVPEHLRGTYAGLAHPASIEYLKNLGVTTVELLPVHAKMDEPFLTDRGLTNYWGYSTLSFFAPENSYATQASQEAGAQAVVDEFRGMVSLLHEAGLEVVLDVVYNHTCEGGDTGPTLSWRGLDSLMYYRRTKDIPRRMIDDTGCGNTVNFSSPRVVQMTIDSLRYWVEEMGVDGFRFDLATTLGRLDTGFTRFHPLFVAMAADPVLKNIKMIAEPWDLGPGGWQTGHFPIPFMEWNDGYRDSIRKFWLTDFGRQAADRPVGGPNELATRLAGSADMFYNQGGASRGPGASVNFISAHDGFTLADLTSYNHKHNMANLEGNRDGSDNNHSWNHGLEGTEESSKLISPDAGGAELLEELAFTRGRSRRNLLATLLVSAGTPMITAGDEFARTQHGNNNAYCQDSPISWIDWDLTENQQAQLEWARYLLTLRRLHPVLRPDHFATGEPVDGDTLPDVSWFTKKGSPIESHDWPAAKNRVFQLRRSGLPYDDHDALIVVNGTLNVAKLKLAEGRGNPWVKVVDTSWLTPTVAGVESAEKAHLKEKTYGDGAKVRMEPQSMLVFLSKKKA